MCGHVSTRHRNQRCFEFGLASIFFIHRRYTTAYDWDGWFGEYFGGEPAVLSLFTSSPLHGGSLCFSSPLQGFSSSFTTSFLGSGRWCTVRVSDCVRHLCLRPGGEQRLFHARLDPGACFFFLLLQDFRGGTWDRCPRDLVVSIFFCFRHDDILPVLDLRELFMWFFFFLSSFHSEGLAQLGNGQFGQYTTTSTSYDATRPLPCKSMIVMCLEAPEQ